MEIKIKETETRSVVKSAIWRVVGVLVLGAVTYFYTRQWVQTSWITFLHHGVFFFVFWAHERFYLHTDFVGLKRKILKMITYESILGFLILGVITLIVTGDVQTMNKITITYILIKHFLYVFNEFIWDKINWGKK